MGQKIDVVGIGCDDVALFSVTTKKALLEAEIIFGSDEQTAIIQQYISPLKACFKSYPKPISELEQTLPSFQNKKIVMLALGDPLFYGIGAILLRFLPAEKLRFHPAVSSLQAALCRFGVPWNDLSVISLHGRALSSLPSLIKGAGRYGVLTDKKNNPRRIAQKLVELGYKNSCVRIAESLGREDERLSTYSAEELSERQSHFAALLVLIIDVT